MNANALMDALARFAKQLPAVIEHLPEDDLRWKPAARTWSVLEIVCHLRDEESGDFRPRLESTLDDPARPWPPIDPEGWAQERKYHQQDFRQALESFLAERRRSVTWLRELNDPDWQRVHEHPHIGPISAGDLLGSWAAHDQLHLRQIAKRLFERAQRNASPYKTDYAGAWTA